MIKDLKLDPYTLDFETQGNGVEIVVSGDECLAQNFSLLLRSLPAFQQLFNADTPKLRSIMNQLEEQLQLSQNLPLDIQRTLLEFNPQTKQLNCTIQRPNGQALVVTQTVA